MSHNGAEHHLSAELVLHANDKDTIKQLLYNGADINYQPDGGWCLLFELISLGLAQEIRYFVKKGMRVDVVDEKGRTALFWAIHHENISVVKVLLELGYNPSKPVVNSLPALHYAVYKDSVEIVNVLLEKGIDIEKKDSFNNTALSYAKLYNRKKMILLLENKMRVLSA